MINSSVTIQPKGVPKKAVIYLFLTYLTPYIFFLFMAIATGGMTLADVRSFCSNPIINVFVVISAVFPIVAVIFMNKLLKGTKSDPESIRKTNAHVRKAELFSLITPAVLNITSSIVVALTNQAKGVQLSAFQGTSYTYFAFVISLGCFTTFSLLFYILFTSNLEQSMSWLPFERKDTTFSFTTRIMLVVFLVMLGLVMFMEAVFYSPASRSLEIKVLLINAVMPIAILVAVIGLIDVYQVISAVNRYIKMSIDLTQELSEKKYDSEDLPVLIRNELALIPLSLNGIKHSTRDLLGGLVESVNSSTASARNLQGEMTNAYDNITAINENIQSVNSEMNNQAAGVEEASAAVNQIIGRTEELNRNIEQQTAAVTQSSAAVEEMVANIRSVTQVLEHNAEAVRELGTASDEGRNSVNIAVETAQEILKQSEAVLEASNIIQAIASQTNLLAMNAAIESAHAGEAGKGFAVVADEIRKLAEQSSTQGKNISTNLKGLSGAIQLVADNTRQVQLKFDKIYDLTKTVSDQERVIMNSMTEQAEGNQQVLDAMHNISDITVSVSDGSAEMLSGGKQVVDEMNILTDVTRKITDRMNEMTDRIQGVSAAMQNVSTASEENQDQIIGLGKQVSQFKL